MYLECNLYFIVLIIALILAAEIQANNDWHSNHKFPNIESFHIYDIENKSEINNKYIEIEINNEQIKLEFNIHEMRDHNARVAKAAKFVEKYLIPLMDNGLKFNGGNPDTYLHKNQKDGIAIDIANRIFKKVQDHIQTYAYGPIAIKKRWAHGTNLVYHRGALTLSPAIERFGGKFSMALLLLSFNLSYLTLGSLFAMYNLLRRMGRKVD
jgi:hypothetical protein